jgi:peptide/nickel transport system substrate-binding protein
VFVKNPQINRLFSLARSGQMNRRQLLETGLRLGLASPVILSLIEAAPKSTAAAPAASASLPTNAGAAQESSGTFTILTIINTEDIDPHYTYNDLASNIAFAVYESLVTLRGESTDEFDPVLAESWEVSDDQSTYTFTLYPHVLFSDGTPANAQAVKDSYARWLALDAAPVNVISRFCDSPDKMEVVDETTIRFNLGSPQPLFLAAMASSYGPMVISPTAIAENATEDDPYAHEWAKQFAIGSGPYVLDSYSITDGMVLSRHEGYHRGWEGNHFDQIIYRVVPEEGTRRQLLERGEADAAAYNLTIETLDAMRENPALQVVEYPSTAITWTLMNAPRLLTPEVRQGFSYAFPYDEVQNAVYQGLIKRTGPIPEGVRGYNPDVFLYSTDLDRAKELILAGGFNEGDVFEYMVDANDERDQTVAQLFQANVQQAGFNLELVSVDNATIESTIYGELLPDERPHFMGSWGWWPDYNDPWNHLYPNFSEANIGSGGANGGAWSNPRFEEIMAEAATYEDEEHLIELMTEVQSILTELDPPAIYLGQVIRYTVLGADIQGYVPNSLYLDNFKLYDMSRSAT